MKGQKHTLRGTIISFRNGIQAVKTESREPGKEVIHFMGFTRIKCPHCEKKMPHMGTVEVCRPCEHVKEGTRVLCEYKVQYEGGIATRGYWVARPYV
jgi:adenine-specific DNA methylase